MLETLSIIAYKQPVTKAEIEKIRGVKCDHAINKLVEYELVRELGRLDAPGRPILLGTTEEFLRCFGVQGLEELPAVDPVQSGRFQGGSRGRSTASAWMFRRKDKMPTTYAHDLFGKKIYHTTSEGDARWSFREMLICTGSVFMDRISCFITCCNQKVSTIWVSVCIRKTAAPFF